MNPYPILPMGPMTVQETLETGLYGLHTYALACGLSLPANARRVEVVRALLIAGALVDDNIFARPHGTNEPEKGPIVRRGPGMSPYDGLRAGTEPGAPQDEEEYDGEEP